MTVDYTVASLPQLVFGECAPITWERFTELAGDALDTSGFAELETEIRNAVAEARGGEKYKRETKGVSLYWRNRTLACFQEQDVAKREKLLDRVWWDAAAELTDLAAPLGKGALATYAVRLKLAIKNSRISDKTGNEALERLTAAGTDEISNQGTTK